MNDKQRPLEDGFESECANQTVGVDTIWGGDIGLPEGAAHFIADSYPKSEVQLPSVYMDSRAAALRKSGGVEPGSAEMVRKFVEEFGLLDSRSRLVESLGPDESVLRQRFAENMGTAFAVMARTALAVSEGSELPPFEERYQASVHRAPELVDTSELRDRLRRELSSTGIEITDSKTLRDAVKEWEHRVGFVDPGQFAESVATASAELTKLTRERIFNTMDLGVDGNDANLKDVPFDGLTFKTLRGVPYTGSSAYEGGLTPDGKPALRGLIEYNTDHPVTKPGLYHLVSHEIVPGHYIDSAVADLDWHSGKLGFEAVANTMCTGATALREGWAQNSLAMLYGGSEQDVIDSLGSEHAIQYILERLQDAGKQNASILFQGRHVGIDEVKKHLEVQCVLSDAYVKKLAGAWAKHPIMGPMYGPAYAVGYDIVRSAIDKHGANKVAKAVMHRYGYLDLDTFQMAMDKAA